MVNGLLIPGGETTYLLRHRTYIRTVRRFVELALHSRTYFPIWGTCFGMEALLSVIGGFTSFTSSVAHGLAPLHLTSKSSRMLRRFSKKSLHRLETTAATLQNHEYGLLVDEFKNNRHLTGFYQVVATATDEAGKEYVAAIEAIHKPIYGVMWHPERQTDKESDGFAEFFVRELRKNKNVGEVYFPSVRTLLTERPCTHYPEHQGEGCYFFRL
jgi:anthranilate/para-aminobenzoate synthase component II